MFHEFTPIVEQSLEPAGALDCEIMVGSKRLQIYTQLNAEKWRKKADLLSRKTIKENMDCLVRQFLYNFCMNRRLFEIDWDGVRERVKKRQIELGMKQNALASEAGMSSTNLNKFLKGSVNSLSIDAVVRLSLALGTTTDYLIKGGEDIETRATISSSEALLRSIRYIYRSKLVSSVDSEFAPKKDEFIIKIHFPGMHGPIYGFVDKLNHVDGLRNDVETPGAIRAIEESSVKSQAAAIESASEEHLKATIEIKKGEDLSSPYGNFVLEDLD